MADKQKPSIAAVVIVQLLGGAIFLTGLVAYLRGN